MNHAPSIVSAHTFEGSLESGSSTPTTWSSVSSAGSNGGSLEALVPYNNYLPPAKRELLAKREFDVQMAERELKLKELDKSLQRYTAPRMRTYTVPFVIDDDTLKLATLRFPRTIFKCSQDSGHDHPGLHLETMIAVDNAVRRIPAGHTVYDMFGSPTRCAALNRAQQRSTNPKKFVAYTSLMTEKDHLRALTWHGLPYVLGTGDILADFGYNADGTCKMPFSPHATTLFFGHTLYYMDEAILIELLSFPGIRAVATVHRHAGESGQMFAGEATYAKKHGVVEQVNAQTGERYIHRDLSYLFESKQKVRRVGEGAYTWTLHKISDETWVVELVAVDCTLDERFVSRNKSVGPVTAANEMNHENLLPTQFPHPGLATLPSATCYMMGGVPVIKLDGADLPPIKVSCPKLIDYLITHMVGKPRDATRLQDLFALARTHVNDGGNFAGKLNFSCPSRDIAGHVVLAFLTGVEDEVSLLRAVACYRTWTREHHALADFSAVVVNSGVETHGRAAFSVLNRINESRKQGDIVSGILHAFDS